MHVHFVGICGTAMASLAGLMKSFGHKVTGSDQNIYPPMSTQLEQLQIPVQLGYRAENLSPKPDLVIIGNVISRGNPEAEAVLSQNIPYTSLAKAMGEFVIAGRQSIVVAGTHGKTTTTSMVSVMADRCGIASGFLIGGIPENYGRSFRAPEPNAHWFVIEGDEYDTAFFDKVPKFVHYRPRHVILTSVEFDHADIYKDLAAVKDAFKKLLELIPEDGTLIACADDANVRELLKYTNCKNVRTYGDTQGDYRIQNREVAHGRNQFSVEYRGERIADLALKAFGLHNSLNALAAFALADSLNWPKHFSLQGLADFKGVKRRQEIIGEVRGVRVVEDFAHHPTAVGLTIASVKERFPGARILAVFEPRSATSRRKIFQKEYVKAFLKSDLAVIAQAFDQSKIKDEERFSVSELIEDLKAEGLPCELGSSTEKMVDFLSEHARAGDVILIMSNGGFDDIYKKLLKKLSSTNP